MNNMNNMNQFPGGMQAMPNMNQQQQQQPQRPPNQQQQGTDYFRSLIIQYLKSKPPPNTGWQASLTMQERAQRMWNLFTSLRLLAQSSPAGKTDPAKSDHQCFQWTISIDSTLMQNCTSRQEYEKDVNDRLQQLAQRRQNNANNNPIMPGSAIPQPSPHFQLQPPQRQNQPQNLNSNMNNNNNPPPPMQQQFGMTPAAAPSLPPSQQQQQQPQQMMNRPPQQQQHQQQQQQLNPMAFMPAMQQQQQQQHSQPPLAQPGSNQQIPQQMSNPLQQPHMNDPQVVNQARALVQRLQAQGQAAGLEQMLLKNMTPAQIQGLQSSGVNLLELHFRRQVINRLQQARQANSNGQQPQQAGQAQQQTQQQQHQNRPATNQQQPSNNSANSQPSNIDFSRFAGQQADAQRSQAAGADVVPASVSNASMNSGAGGMQFNQLGPLGGINPAIPPNSGVNAQPSNQIQQVNNGPQNQVSQQPQNLSMPNPARMNTTAPTMSRQGNLSLHGQVGGLQGNQPSPAMRTLNQPFAAPGSNAGRSTPQQQQQPQQQPPSATRPPSQLGNQPRTGPPGQPGGPPVTQQVQQLFHSLPQEVQNHLKSLPHNQQRQALLRLYQEYQIKRNQALAASQAPQGLAQMPQPTAAPNIPQDFQLFQPGQPNPQSVPQQQAQQQLAPNMPNMQNDPLPQMNDAMKPNMPTAANLKLPVPVIKQRIPDLVVPPNVHTWGEFTMWMNEHGSHVRPDQRDTLKIIQRAQYMDVMRREGHGPMNMPNPTGPTMLQQPGMPPNLGQFNQMQNVGQPKPAGQLSQASIAEFQRRGFLIMDEGLLQLRMPTAQETQTYRMKMGERANSIPATQLNENMIRERLHNINQVDSGLADELKRNWQKRLERGRQAGMMQNQQQAAPSQKPQLNQNFAPQMNQPTPQGLPNTQRNQHGAMNGIAAPIPQMPNKAFMPMMPVGPSHGNNQMGVNTMGGPMTSQQMGQQSTSPELLARMQAEQQRNHVQSAQKAQQNQNQSQKPQVQTVGQGIDLKTASFEQLEEDSRTRMQSRPAAPAFNDPQRFQHFKKLYIGLMQKYKPVLSKCLRPAWNFASRLDDAQIKQFLKQCLDGYQLLDYQIIQGNMNPQAIYVTEQELQLIEKIFQRLLSDVLPNIDRRVKQGQLSQQQASGQDKPQAAKSEGTPANKRSPKRAADGESKASATQNRSQPSFSLSPQGTPMYAGKSSSEFALHLPQKKAKKSSISSSSTPAPQPAQAPATRANVPGQMQQQAPPQPLDAAKQAQFNQQQAALAQQVKSYQEQPFKCRFQACESFLTGFKTEDELKKHEKDAHKYTGNALDFCLANMRAALGVENNQSRNNKDAVSRPNSTIGARPLTPISRPGTSTGPSKLLKAAQEGQRAALQNSPAMKRESSSVGFSLATKPNLTQTATSTDPWDSSTLSAGELSSLFTLSDEPEDWEVFMEPEDLARLKAARAQAVLTPESLEDDSKQPGRVEKYPRTEEEQAAEDQSIREWMREYGYDKGYRAFWGGEWGKEAKQDDDDSLSGDEDTRDKPPFKNEDATWDSADEDGDDDEMDAWRTLATKDANTPDGPKREASVAGLGNATSMIRGMSTQSRTPMQRPS